MSQRKHSNVNKGTCFYNIGLKALLQQGTSDPVLYGDLVYSKELFESLMLVSNKKKRKIIKHFKSKVEYNMDIMRQSACLHS